MKTFIYVNPTSLTTAIIIAENSWNAMEYLKVELIAKGQSSNDSEQFIGLTILNHNEGAVDIVTLNDNIIDSPIKGRKSLQELEAEMEPDRDIALRANHPYADITPENLAETERQLAAMPADWDHSPSWMVVDKITPINGGIDVENIMAQLPDEAKDIVATIADPQYLVYDNGNVFITEYNYNHYIMTSSDKSGMYFLMYRKDFDER